MYPHTHKYSHVCYIIGRFSKRISLIAQAHIRKLPAKTARLQYCLSYSRRGINSCLTKELHMNYTLESKAQRTAASSI